MFVALGKEQYLLAGRLFSLSIVHNGPSPNFLHRELYAALSRGYSHAKPTVDDVRTIDPEIGQNLVEVSRCKSQSTMATHLIVNVNCDKTLQYNQMILT